MNAAQSVRLAKERNPSDFCRDPKCLWRVQTRTGYKPCPRHPASDHPKDCPKACCNPAF